jgi:hypothetical protein
MHDEPLLGLDGHATPEGVRSRMSHILVCMPRLQATVDVWSVTRWPGLSAINGA